MKEKLKQVGEIRTWPGEIPVEHLYTVGSAGKVFFKGLSEGRLLGSRCPKCGNVTLPPKLYCAECFIPGELGVEIKELGEIDTFTFVFEDLSGNPLEEPIPVAMIRFPDVRGGLIHRLGEVTPEKVQIGLRVEPLFRKERRGELRDILYFRPVKGRY